MIQLSDVTFSYRNAPVLEGSIELAEKSFTGIIGPNGGGKTTFLKLLMGMLQPDRGSVHINGKSPQEVRTQIGYVPQMRNFDLDFPISVIELVLMGALSKLNMWGRYPKQAHEAALHSLELVGLADLADHPFGSLSGGQQQRALIARALCSSPGILLLDEPTASVDPKAEAAIHSLILDLKHHITILMVTHELPGLIKEVDSVLCINRTFQTFEPSKVCGHFAMGLYHPQEDSSC